MSKPQFPVVPRELIEALEERFRDRIPDAVPDPAATGVLVGQQSIIRFLRREFTKQHNPKEIL
jgi:hypothetical protein